MRLIAEQESPGYLAFRSEPDFHRFPREKMIDVSITEVIPFEHENSHINTG